MKQNSHDQVMQTVTETKSTKVIFDLTREKFFGKALRIVATVKHALSWFKREMRKNFRDIRQLMKGLKLFGFY